MRACWQAVLIGAIAVAACAAPRGSTITPAATTGHRFDWSVWEPDAFAKAQTEGRIILINVVAEWCHWCHVMEETTYADPEVADLLARHFVTIRVDSDARPDVADRYAAWGWPATAVLTPDAHPVLELRGYQDPTSFEQLLRELVRDRDAGKLSRRDPPPPRPPVVDMGLVELRALATKRLDFYYADDGQGGWGKNQKYPWATPLEHAFVRARIHDQPEWKARALLTLAGETELIDPVWGGMYQYSLRAVWTRPHYEKLAAIQGDALESFAIAHRMTKDKRWAKAATDIERFLIEHMRSPDGTFFTSQDADLRTGDESVVGDTYFVLGDSERRALGIPRIDRNIYADLNGIIINGLCAWFIATHDADALEVARTAAESILATHKTEAGALKHAASDDGTLLHLRDQAAMGRALLALYRATGNRRYLDRAERLANAMRASLEDTERGGFFAHSEDPNAIGVFAERRKPVDENGRAARFLLELHRYLDDDEGQGTPYREAAERAVRAVGHERRLAPAGKTIGHYLLALEALTAPTVDFTVVGEAGDAKADALYASALRYFEPRKVLERSRPGERYPDIGKPAVYLCTQTACSSPVTDPDDLDARADRFVATSLPPSR